MKILVTGSNGFIGKNLIAELKRKVWKHLWIWCRFKFRRIRKIFSRLWICFHLAGVNRPKDESEFLKGNLGFTTTLLELLKNTTINLSYDFFVNPSWTW